MIIGNIDTDKTVFVIAEIGNNHEGNFDTAVKMLEAVATTGAHAVKFQTFIPEHYVHVSQKERFQRLKSFQLTYKQFEKLSDIARQAGLLFISTPFDPASADFLSSITDAIKVSSSDNTFYPLLQRISGSGKPVIISTGLANMDEIAKAASFFNSRQLALLHCVTAYPVPCDQVNLSYIAKLRNRFNCTIGYSDHSLGSEASVLSVACGARIIEKHFTLDRNMSDFHDHKISLEPKELADLVKRVKDAELMLGNAEDIQASEVKVIQAVRRSVVSSAKLSKGQKITVSDITWVRPGGGISPGDEGRILGKILKHDVDFHHVFSEDDFE